MAIPLLRTKFNIPPIQTNLIRRERLLHILNEGLQGDHLLSLICAPTGYGKTTLVSQWIQQYNKENFCQATLKRKFVWLTLDQGDNDLARFTSYLVTTLQQIKPDLGQSTLATLQNIRSPSIHLIATLLINDLSNLAESSIVILEDYHTVNAQSVHDFMTFLIDHLPLQLHLVIISRSDPPLPLARLRARGQLTEIRQDDLAMTEAETAEFLVGHMGLDLSPNQLHVLESRTEGWVAGLQLAMLSMRHTKNIPEFIQAFSGGYEYIADYLTKEVLEQQNESTQNFLLQTSILKQFTAPLCEAVTGQSQVTQLLKMLEESNIFLIPLDYQGEWYRYHALFADLLRKRLQQSSKEILLDLHNRAGRWYGQHMMREQAIEHFLEGENYDEAARSIEEIAERILMHGQTATILYWLDAFPIDQLYHHPVLIVYQGVAMMMLGKKPENALSMLEELASSAEKFQGEKDTLQALFSVLKGNALEAIRLSESALQQLPAERSFLRILAADGLAMSHALRGDLASALKAFEMVVETAQEAGNVIMMLLGLANLAGLRFQLGHLHQAWDDYKKVFDISTEKLGGYSQPLGRVLLGMGELKREWNDLEGAGKYFYEAAENFRQFIDIGLSVAYLSRARVYLSQGEWEKVQALLEEARQHSRASKTTALDDNLTELMQARLWIAQGELEKAEQWAHKSGLFDKPLEDLEFLADRNATAFELIQGGYLAFARLLLAQNKSLKALDILAVIRTHNEKRGQMRRVIECLVLEAIAYHQQEADEPAMRAISMALTLAEPEGYIRTFLDEGQPVAQLLYQAINYCQSPAYARNLLTAFTKEEFQPPTIEKKAHEGQGLIEALSEREMEILKLIADGLTNQAIAMKLHVTLSTVKGHNSNVYSKLGVENRTQAVRMARDLDLL